MGTLLESRTVLLQAGLYLGIALWLARRPDVRRLLAGLPSAWRRGVVVFLGLLVLGQLAGRSTATFPFVRWDMYGNRRPSDPYYFEFTGVTAAGREVPLNFARRFPALNRQITTGLEKLSDRIETARDPDEVRRLEATYADTIRGLAQRYDAGEPDNVVRAVRVWRVSVPSPFRGRDAVVRSFYREVVLP